MDTNVTKYYIDLLLNFIKKYFKYLFLLLILILVIKKLYNVSPYNQISSTLIKVDKLYRNVFLQQKNFCSNTYKKYRLGRQNLTSDPPGSAESDVRSVGVCRI